jgi:hypothetical protein
MMLDADTEVAGEIAPKSPLGGAEIVALVLGLLPFVAQLSVSAQETINGGVIASSRHDYVALGGGAAAIIFALIGLIVALRGGRYLRKRLIADGLLIALGLYQAARGFGLL